VIGRWLFEGVEGGEPTEERPEMQGSGTARLEEGDDPEGGLGQSGPRRPGDAC
jgi:hypothetical protein